MSNEVAHEVSDRQSENNEVHSEESIKQIRQLLENLAIVRRVYYTKGKHYNKTLDYFDENIGQQHTAFVQTLLDYIVEEFEFHTENAPA